MNAFFFRLVDCWIGLILLPAFLALLFVPVLTLFLSLSVAGSSSADLWVGILLAVIFWPSSLLLLVFLLPVGPIGRLMSFLLGAPVPLGRVLSAPLEGEQTLIRQRFVSGSFGTGLCGFNYGLHVTLTNKRLIVEMATTLPYVCLLAVERSQIHGVQPATYPATLSDSALAFSITVDGHDTCFYFLPKDKTAWLQECTAPIQVT